MGRTKGVHIHTLAKALVKRFEPELSESFEENKKKLHEKHMLDYSKKDLNKLAAETAKLVHKKRHPPAIVPRPRIPRETGERSFGRRDYGGYGRDRE